MQKVNSSLQSVNFPRALKNTLLNPFKKAEQLKNNIKSTVKYNHRESCGLKDSVRLNNFNSGFQPFKEGKLLILKM
jgi:hypothetical protein